MKPAIVLDANDIKLLIAEKYGVKPEEVIKSQYSYTVVMDDHRDQEQMSKTEVAKLE